MSIDRIQTNERMSKIVKHGNTAYFCGQVASDYSKGIKGQTESVLEKIEALLEVADSDMERLLSVTIYLKDMALFQEMNEVWDNWIEEGFAPARACVQAKMANPDILVEMSVICATD